MSRYSFFLILGIFSLSIAACSGTSSDSANDTASDEAPAESAARCREVGMDGFLGKPFRIAELEAVLRATPTR